MDVAIFVPFLFFAFLAAVIDNDELAGLDLVFLGDRLVFGLLSTQGHRERNQNKQRDGNHSQPRIRKPQFGVVV